MTLVRVNLQDGQELNYIVETTSYSRAVIIAMNYIITFNPGAAIKSIELPGSLFIPKTNDG